MAVFRWQGSWRVHPSGTVHQESACFAGCAFCPCWAAPGRYTPQRTLVCAGGRVRQDATYISGRNAELIGLVNYETRLVEAMPLQCSQWWWVSGSFVGLVGSFGLVVFSLLDFMLVVDKISTP